MKPDWKIILIWICVTLVFTCVLKFVTWPFISKIIASQSTMSQLQQEYNQKKNFRDSLVRASKNNDITEYAIKWDTILPVGNDQSGIFSVMVEDLARNHGMNVDTISFDKNSKKPTGLSLPNEIEATSFTFSGNGQYDQLLAFIIDSSRLSRINKFNHITVKSQEQNFALSFIGEIYSVKNKPQYGDLGNFNFYDKLKTKTDSYIKFTLPSTTETSIGKDNPFK